MDLIWDDFFCLRGMRVELAMSGGIFGLETLRQGVTSIERPRMLLNIVQGTGWLPLQRRIRLRCHDYRGWVSLVNLISNCQIIFWSGLLISGSSTASPPTLVLWVFSFLAIWVGCLKIFSILKQFWNESGQYDKCERFFILGGGCTLAGSNLFWI